MGSFGYYVTFEGKGVRCSIIYFKKLYAHFLIENGSGSDDASFLTSEGKL